MRKVVYRLILSIFLLALSITQAASDQITIYLPLIEHSDERTQVVRLVNQERSRFGCPQTTEHPALMKAAQAKSDDLQAGRGVLLGDLNYYAAYGYTVDTDIADVMVGAPTPQEAVQKLFGAADGRGPLKWCPKIEWVYDIGVGVAEYEGLPWWTIAVSARQV